MSKIEEIITKFSDGSSERGRECVYRVRAQCVEIRLQSQRNNKEVVEKATCYVTLYKLVGCVMLPCVGVCVKAELHSLLWARTGSYRRACLLYALIQYPKYCPAERDCKNNADFFCLASFALVPSFSIR